MNALSRRAGYSQAMHKVAVFMLFAMVSVATVARDAEQPSGCAQLCGSWVLDESLTEPVEPAVDAAMERYRVPRQNGPRIAGTGEWIAPEGDAAPADAPPAAGSQRLPGLREQLMTALAPPPSLAFSTSGKQILLRAGTNPERRIFPGEPRSRVDSRGTSRISADWKKGVLALTEDFGGSYRNAESYVVQPDGTLQLALVLDRPGVKQVRLRAVYRRVEAGR
jgi:hypothetical protein